LERTGEWITRDEFHAVRVGARRVRIPRDDQDRFLAASSTPPPLDPSENKPGIIEGAEALAAALESARAALAVDRKADLAIAPHAPRTTEPLLDTNAGQGPPMSAEPQTNDMPAADD
jgi:hypothetical protein